MPLFVTRKFGKLIRGTASRSQILMAATLGGLLGFVPGFILPGDLGGGFLQAPGLILFLLGLVVVLNANLALFGLVTAIAKLLSLVCLPVSFAVGRFLLDGPTEGLFRVLVNAPVTAWFGLQHYATAGGLVVGLAFGIVAGVVIWKGMHGLRAKMATLETGSERYQKLTSKRWVRLLTWMFLGKGHGKKTWRELAETDTKNKIVRWPGLAAVLVVAALLWFAQDQLGGAWLKEQATTNLARWNGATVDLQGATLDLAGGHIALDGLAMADAQNLDRDAFRARSMAMDVSTTGLLSGRMVVDRLASSDAASGVQRTEPAKRIAPEAAPAPEPPPGPGKTIEDYLKDAEQWKARLEQVSEWVKKFTGGGEPPAEEPPAERDARVASEVATLGYTDVVAAHLIAQHPTVLIRELAFEGLKMAQLDGDVLDVHGQNLSSQPALAEAPATLSIKSRAGTFALELHFDPAAPTKTGISLDLTGVPVDSLAGDLTASPIHGGTLDVRIAGSIDPTHEGGPWLEVPVVATLHGTTLSVGGKQSTIDQLAVPIGVRGPITSPRIAIDDQGLADALVAAGKKELADQVRANADALLNGKVPGIGNDVGDVIEGKKTAAQLAEEAKQKAEAEAKKRAEEEAKKHIPGLGDIFKKKDG